MASVLNWLPVTFSTAGTALAFFAFGYQVRRARFTQSIDLLLKFEATFFGAEKRAQRSRAAGGLLREAPDYTEAEDILDFFETLALLTRKGALDRYMIWHTFFYWIDRYYVAAATHIEDRHRTEPTVWQDIGPFVESLRKLQGKEAGLAYSAPSSEELVCFLREEQAEG